MTLEIPAFYERVYKLDQVVDVDYYVPGCPPQPGPGARRRPAWPGRHGRAARPRASVVGASERALCDDCPRTKSEKKVKRFYRPWQIIPDPDECLMEQGIFCGGSATRSGCGVRCPNSGMPCRGCYGPLPGVVDQGAKLLCAVASIIDSKDPEEIDAILAALPDFVELRLPLRHAGLAPAKELPVMTRKISIDPITRLEGHGKIEIFLDDDGAVQDCFFQIPELRGFERFVVGPAHRGAAPHRHAHLRRLPGEPPHGQRQGRGRLLRRTRSPPLAHKLRDMYYQAHFIHSHIAHFYALAAPDFVLGPDADPATRNILGVVPKVGLEIGGEVIGARGLAQEIQRIIGGRNTRTSGACPAAWPRASSKEELEQIKPLGRRAVRLHPVLPAAVPDVVLANAGYVDLILNGPYTLDVHNMGLVDENNAPNFYDGKVRVVDFEGKEICKYAPQEYADYRGRARRAVDVPQVPLPQEARLEGLLRGHRLEPVLRHAAGAPQRGRPDGHPQGPGSLRGDVRDPRRSSLQAPCWPTTGRGWWRWCRTPRRLQRYCADPEITSDQYRVVPTADHRRGRRHRRGHARHAHASLHLRRERASARAPTSSWGRPTTTRPFRW